MCGLVGFASNSFAPVPMKELFKQMLLADTLRGHHATGVAAIDTINNSSTIYKRAVPGPMFLADPEAEDKLFHNRHNFNIYLGHNRWATAGKADDDENAHPFEHDHIIGAHNGTVRDRSLLEDNRDFVVDSDNVFYHMALHGLKDTVKNLDGAFCLTWYDKSDNSLNFIRNGERPLAFARLQSGCIVWASEKEMLYWLVKRSKSQKFCETEADGKKETALWDLPEYTHFKLPYNPSTRTMGKPELVVLPKPTFRQTYHGNGYGMGWGSDDDYTDWWTGNTNTNPSRREVRPAPASSTTETAYQRTARECIEKFATSGNIGSWLEIEFLGHSKHRTQAGYESSMSIFRYVSWKDNHPQVILHSYNHTQCYTKDWTDADIGKRVFAKISGVIPHNPSTADGIKNEGLLGCQISVEAINETRPPKMFSYFDAKAEDEVQAEIDAYMEKRNAKKQRSPLAEAESSLPSNVVRLAGKRNKKQRKQRRENALEQSGLDHIAEKPLLDTDHRADDEGGFEFRFASGQRVDISCYMRIVEENHKRCSHCNKDITKSAISALYLTEWFDRGEGQLQQLLSCSSKCRQGTVFTCQDADDIYDEYYQQGDV